MTAESYPLHWPDARTWYQVLGVHGNASWQTIETAYRRRRSETHPDRGGAPSEFHAVRKAYEKACEVRCVR